MGKNTAGRLGGVHVERQPIGGGNVGELRFEIARRVEPLRVQREVEAFGRRPERRLAGNVEARRDADDRLAKREFLHAELLDEHLERQFGQDRLLRACIRRRRFGGKRAPQKLHASDRELIDLKPPAEQSQPVPDQPNLVDLEPRALAVGEDDVADRRVGRQHAVHRADRDAHRWRGQSPRDQVGDHALVFFRRCALAQSERRKSDQRRTLCRRRKSCAIRRTARC